MAEDREGATDDRRDATGGGELRFDADGIVFAARGPSPPRVETVTVFGRVLHRVPWAEVRRVAACDPWPRLRITHRGGDGTEREELEPLDEPESRFAERVVALLAAVPTHAPHARIDAGWLAAPDIEWERVKRMPHDDQESVGDGAYRSTEGSHTEIVRAHRAVRTPLRAFLDWLGSHPGFAFRDQPLEVLVTDDDVYARFRDESVRRVPRAELRVALHGARDGVVYVFGRRARLLLPRMEGCPVEALLDAELARRA